MAENIRESLSALIDGEASEIELHRLLREIGQDSDLKNSDLKKSWATYQQIGSVMGTHPIYAAQQHLELSRQISAAIEAETDFAVDTSPLVKKNRYIKPLGGLAVAASLTLAAIVGFDQLNTDQISPTGQQLVDQQSVESVKGHIEQVESPKPDVKTVAPTQLVADNQVLDPVIESDLRELPPEKQERLRALLLQLDRQLRLDRQLGPQTRVVTYKDKKAP
ncbi:MAG: sigma-E factor negative regulatory protein [Gammaproteobacteria bacterium]|nr:sigma-E factor negative regulatory protein [Gammaproteobacteria bacterium]